MLNLLFQGYKFLNLFIYFAEEFQSVPSTVSVYRVDSCLLNVRLFFLCTGKEEL
jgi:hypothetical protein